MRRRLFLGALALLVCTLSYAQHPLRVYQGAATLMYYTTAVDSITHDAAGSVCFSGNGTSQTYQVSEVDSIVIATSDSVLYTVPSDMLDGWDYGLLLPNQMCLLTTVGGLSTASLAMIQSPEADSCLFVNYDAEGRLLSVYTPEQSFRFSYDGQSVLVLCISPEGRAESFTYPHELSSAVTVLANLYANLRRFLHAYASLDMSGTPCLSRHAQSFLSLPAGLFEEGTQRDLTRLYGRPLPALGGVLDFLAVNDNRDVLLDESPSYTVDNVFYRYTGQGNVEVTFTCRFEPVRSDILQRQGLTLRTREGDEIVTFDTVPDSVTVTRLYDTSLFDKDYSDFIATMPVSVQFWYEPYAVDKTYSKDLAPWSFIYDVKPSITFDSVTVTGTEVIEYDDDNVPSRYKSTYIFDFLVTGTFWFSNIQYIINSESWSNSWEMQRVSVDGLYRIDGWITYSATSTLAHNDYYLIYLNDGTTITSTNTLVCGGEPGDPSFTIGGAPSRPAVGSTARRSAPSLMTGGGGE